MHCMLMDLLHGFEVLSTTEETLFNSRNVSRLVQNNRKFAIHFVDVFWSNLEHNLSHNILRRNFPMWDVLEIFD